VSSKDKDPDPQRPVGAGQRTSLPSFGFDLDDDGATRIITPYTVTGGRTQPRYRLAIEAMVTATVLEPRELSVLAPEQQAIIQFCRDWRSIAEISAVLRLPLGVARILVADMAAVGLVRIHQPDDLESRPDLHLLERVLSGLRGQAASGGEGESAISAANPQDVAEDSGLGPIPASAEAAGLPGSTAPSQAAGASGGGGFQVRYPAIGWDSPSRRRYLRGRCPQSVPVGKPFSLLASIVLAAHYSSAELESFDVPPEGRDVLLVVHAPGLRLLGDQQQTVHVPANTDSQPVRFELRADVPGPRPVSITAWIGGSYLGELIVEITAERDHPVGPHRDVLAEITTEPTEGAVSLVVRYDSAQNAYRFEFRDEDNPEEVTSNLAYDPGPIVEHLVSGLDELAKGRSGYSAAQTRGYLVNSGAGLWRELIPKPLREQFWDRQHRIRQLTILADRDAVPWELLYPRDPGHDAGFLVEQFPVTRAIFGRRPSRRLSLWPARFVLPEGSLPEARDEINAMRRLLDPGQPPDDVIFALTPLQNLIESGDFGLLHFACHNRFDVTDGSSIRLDNVQFTPTLMTTAAIDKVLDRSAPTIFMNACRSAGLNATYNRLDGWASKFLEAGAAAFIGSLWAVCDGTAREFAEEFYGQLRTGCSLGRAVMRARQVAASKPDDPTWLAYTVYGNPSATVNQQ
jgi:Protein of unknown function (DUF742)/CHAT domain